MKTTENTEGGRPIGCSGSAIFKPIDHGEVMRYPEGSVAVWRGKTTEGMECLAIKKTHISGNESMELVTINGAIALVTLIERALSLNTPMKGAENNHE